MRALVVIALCIGLAACGSGTGDGSASGNSRHESRNTAVTGGSNTIALPPSQQGSQIQEETIPARPTVPTANLSKSSKDGDQIKSDIQKRLHEFLEESESQEETRRNDVLITLAKAKKEQEQASSDQEKLEIQEMLDKILRESEPKASIEPSPIPDTVKALQPVFYATNRHIENTSPIHLTLITNDRSMDLKYGLTIVSIPRSHMIGRVERPGLDLWQSAIHLSFIYENEADQDHFRIRSIQSLSRTDFVKQLGNGADSVLLFIHGYNVPFADSIFKAAQIAYDANFMGSVLVFSWPSAGSLLGYDHDRESALFSAEDLLQIFRILNGEIGDKRVYVIAHSLGNEILVNALQQAALSKASLHISELVLAAPDVDRDVFVKKAADINAVAPHMTLYASSADKALLASGEKAWGTRMGYVGKDGPNLVKGIETIDVTAVGDDMLGLDHSTYAGRAVLEDIGHLIISKAHQLPQDRITTLKFMPDREHIQYWLYPK